ncbi:unnamed protein product [Cylicocyclus nassatus]|uniref:Uncharacterized protein n=1 Tax=Cylicocyclus nassatus TaxID=53992 RepID=A0AA36GIB3_CYLNA|nr:unnamed protein product [Cylicocyclus nassatus]
MFTVLTGFLPYIFRGFYKNGVVFLSKSKEILLSLETGETHVLFDEKSLYKRAKDLCESGKGSAENCTFAKFLEENSKIKVSSDMRYVVYAQREAEKEELSLDFTESLSILDRETLVGVNKQDKERQAYFKFNPVGHDYITDEGPNVVHGVFDLFRMDRLHGIHESEQYDFEEKVFLLCPFYAIVWSPKGEKVAIASLDVHPDEKKVHMISYIDGKSYPKVVEMRYAMSYEELLPKFIVSIWDKKIRATKHMKAQLKNENEYCHILHFFWVVMNNHEYLVTIIANRYNTHISIAVCDYESATCQVVFDYEYPKKMYAERFDFMGVRSDNAIYVLLPRATPDSNTYQHIAKLIIKNSTSIQTAKLSFLSLGNFDVKSILAYDRVSDTIYFSAWAPKPTNSHMYSTKGSPATDSWRCLTCKFSNCTSQYNFIHPSFKHVVISCQGPAPPLFYLGELSPEAVKNWIRLSSAQYDEALDMAILPKRITDTIPLEDGYEAVVQITLPPGQDSSSKSFPVLLRTYPGPLFQPVVIDRFEANLWMNANPLILGYAIVLIDGRGSTGRGWKYRSAFYGALGTVEIDDQIDGIRKVLAKYPFLDKNRLTVSGWSYGGYASALMAERAPPGFFKCVISVAPVANFLYYQTSYSDQYMGDADVSAYYAGDITNNVTNFKKTRLLLVHGMRDDNVHFQNSALFIKALQDNGVDFDLMLYPNGDHYLSQGLSHFLKKHELFLTSCAGHD